MFQKSFLKKSKIEHYEILSLTSLWYKNVPQNKNIEV